jgi:glycosyltransferase involved in cell wall biosynthesis
MSHHAVDHFVCATPALTKLFPADRATTIANYPMLEEFNIGCDERPGPSSPPNFIFIGGISAIRGAKEMIEAVQLLPANHRLETLDRVRQGLETGATVCDARLLLIGEFHPPGLQGELQRMPGWSRVDFLSWQPREKLIEHLSRAVAGLVLFHPAPNHTEALPNKIFEYMAAGLPVIATDFPLWRDLISRESCGLLADATDPQSIADAMRRILEQRDEAAAMGQRGAEAVRSRYNWTQEAQRLLALYDALGKSRRPSECTD